MGRNVQVIVEQEVAVVPEPASASVPIAVLCRGCLVAFVEGATRPSLAAALGAIGVALLLLILCLTWITPERMAGPVGRATVAHTEDEYALLTHQASSIARQRWDDDTVTILGASTTREAISSPQHLAGLLSERIGREIRVNVLTSGGLTPYDELVLLDVMRPNLRGILVLDIAPQKLHLDPGDLEDAVARPRMALESPALEALARASGYEVPSGCGNYFLDHYRFFVARPGALLNLVRPVPRVDPHPADAWRPIDEAEWQRAFQHIARWQEGYRANRDWNLGVYGRMIDLAGASGIRVALLESVRNPKVDPVILATPAARELDEEYREDIRRFADQHQIAYWDLGATSGLREDDFVDHNHIRSDEARRRFTRQLALRLAVMLEEPR